MLLTSADDPAEFQRLTGKRRHSAHARALRAMGIEHRVRPDGVVVVSREHVERLLGGESSKPRAKREVTPNWGAIR